MSHVIVNKSPLFAAATAISAVGFLTAPAPAQAVPMLPLAPASTGCTFGGDFALQQSNGARVSFSSTGPAASGRALATGTGAGQMHGNVSGSINGRQLDFTIRWDNGPRGHYTGDVSEFDDFAHGTTVDEANPDLKATWDSTVPLVCIAPGLGDTPIRDLPTGPTLVNPPPPPAAPAAPAPNAATVTSDVDLYDVPGGDGSVIGMLRKGEVVGLAGNCPANDWCQVIDKGWAWGEFLQGMVKLPKG